MSLIYDAAIMEGAKMGSSAAADLGNLGMNIYSIFANERANKQNLKQQKYNNWFAENSASIRAKDLANAGLHPTLAAGGSADMPGFKPMEGQAPQQMTSNIGANALLDSQIRNLQAQTAKINAETTHVQFAERMAEASAQLSTNADARAQNNHEWELTLRKNREVMQALEVVAKRHDVNAKELELKLKNLDYDTVKDYGHHIPSSPTYYQQLKEIVTRTAGATSEYVPALIELLQTLLTIGVSSVGHTAKELLQRDGTMHILPPK